MAFTRSQAKKQQEQPQQRQQIHRNCKNSLPDTTSTNTNTNTNTNTRSPIDFVDASIEWRKNKIKRENCTFEYIYI
jgi:hypothetical protein